MTQVETSRLRFVRSLSTLGLFALTASSGCGGQAPSGLFSSNAIESGGDFPTDSAGNSAGGSGGSLSASGGDANDGNSAGTSSGNANGGNASGGTASAGAPNTAGDANGGSGGDGLNGGGSAGAPPNTGGSGGAPIASVCDSQLVKPAALVTDFEQGVAGWLGYINDAPAPVTSSEPGANMTAQAATFSGGAARISGMYFKMPCRDVSDFDGISFWGKSDGPSAVRFLAVIPATDPTPGIGDCNPATMTCSDHPGKPFNFGSDWVHYHAAWTELKQLGFGNKASFAGVINALLWINDGSVEHFSFSIDEISFYQGAPPSP